MVGIEHQQADQRVQNRLRLLWQGQSRADAHTPNAEPQWKRVPTIVITVTTVITAPGMGSVAVAARIVTNRQAIVIEKTGSRL